MRTQFSLRQRGRRSNTRGSTLRTEQSCLESCDAGGWSNVEAVAEREKGFRFHMSYPWKLG